MSFLNKNSVYLSLSGAVYSITTLCLTIFLARQFEDKEVYGNFFQLFLIVNFSLAIVSGVPLGLNYFFGKYKEYTDRYFLLRRLFYLIVYASILIGALVYFASPLIAQKFGNNFFLNMKPYFVAFLVLKLVNSYFGNFYLLTKGIKFFFKGSVLILFLTIALLFSNNFFHFQAKKILIFLTLIEVFRFFFYFSKSTLYLKLKPLEGVSLKKIELSYILAITGVGLLNTANVYLDKYMVSFMMNSRAFAEYQVAAFTIPFIFIISGSIITALIPEFSRLFNDNKISKLVSIWKGATTEIIFLLLPIFVFCFFFGEDLIVGFYGQEYQYSGFLFRIYTLRFLGSVVLFSLTMGAIGLQNWVLLNAGIGLLFNGIFNYILIQNHGVLGAVIATILSTYLGYVICIVIIKKIGKIRFIDYFPVNFYIKTISISVILALIFKYINFFEMNFAVTILKALLFYIIVLLILIKFSREPMPTITKIKEKIPFLNNV